MSEEIHNPESVDRARRERLLDQWQDNDCQMSRMMDDNDSVQDCRLLMAYRMAAMKARHPQPDVDKAWERFRQSEIVPGKVRKQSIRYAVYVSLAVASFIGIIWGASVMLTSRQSAKTHLAFEANNEQQHVLMGLDRNHLTRIEQMAKDDGAVVDDDVADFSHVNARSKGNRVLHTPRGKAYRVVLSDGTTVVLNADSHLSFPVRFQGDTRTVYLSGEAYFKVTRDAHHPFVVHTNKVSTRVLGTEFNLKAYPESDCHVTLISGSVAVNANNRKKEIILQPGEDAALQDTEDFKVTCVDTEYYIQWKEGYFYFDNLPLIDVLKEIGRWYNVSIEIKDNSLMSYRLHFIADRNAGISEVVKSLNTFSYLEANLIGNKIVLMQKGERRAARKNN